VLGRLVNGILGLKPQAIYETRRWRWGGLRAFVEGAGGSMFVEGAAMSEDKHSDAGGEHEEGGEADHDSAEAGAGLAAHDFAVAGHDEDGD
jgi:hypothetical protein